jgi:hypothetical protein
LAFSKGGRETLLGIRSRESGRIVFCVQSRSRRTRDNSPNCAKPPSVAPGGTFGLQGLVFLRMVTLDRSEAGGSRVVMLEMERGIGDKVSTILGMWLKVSKVGPKKGHLSTSGLGTGSGTEQNTTCGVLQDICIFSSRI